MKCPFRKRSVYNAGRNTGSGYPLEWVVNEEFEECIGEDCIAFFKKEVYSNIEKEYVIEKCCGICQKRKYE